MSKLNKNGLRQLISVVLFTVASMALDSCTKNTDNSTCNSSLPDQVSFSIDVLPIFRTNCSIIACHSGGDPSGHLNLEDANAYSALSKTGSGYINTSSPTKSILYSQLLSTSQPMPPSGKLDQCKINLILKWIEQGAKNN